MSRYDEDLIAPKTLADDEMKALLRVTGERRSGFRDNVIFAIALATALREHEIVGLDVGDVYDEAGKPRVRVTLRVFKRSSKLVASQQIMLGDPLRAKLEKFRGWKERNGESLAADAPLFISRNHNRLSTRQLRHLVHVWQKRAGSQDTLNFHCLRHTACTTYFRLTKDIRATQRFSRHRSLAMVTRYTHPGDEAQLRSVQVLPC